MLQSWDHASYNGLHKLRHGPDSWQHSTVSRVLVSHAIKQVQCCWQTVSQWNAGVKLIILIHCPQALYSMINQLFHRDSFVKNKKTQWHHLLQSKIMLSVSLGGCGGSCAWGSIHWGGLVETGKQKKGGGDWRELVRGYGDGQLSSIPQGTACYAKQNQSFSKRLGLICQPQQTLSVSPPPTPPTLFTVGAFLFIHRGMDIFKAYVKW